MKEFFLNAVDYIFNIIVKGFLGMYGTGLSEITFGILYAASIVIIAVAAYLLGSLNFAIIISSKQYKQDIRDFGSKNAGMTNMMRTYGKQAAALTLLGDILKAVVACLIGYLLIGLLGAYIAGVFCILGHIFPIYYKFKGGKGVVTAGVTIFMCNPIVFLILITTFVLIVLATKYISLASVMCMLIYPIFLNVIEPIMLRNLTNGKIDGSIGGFFAVIMTCMVVIKHWSNIKRLLNGTENKFSFKKSVKKPSDKTEEK